MSACASGHAAQALAYAFLWPPASDWRHVGIDPVRQANDSLDHLLHCLTIDEDQPFSIEMLL
jgi:hypothetical protein